MKLNTDSKLLVGQITNEYEAKEDGMKRYLKLTSQLVSNFDGVRLVKYQGRRISQLTKWLD